MGRLEEAALYLHVPFCRAKCPYCDFYSEPLVPSPSLVERFLAAVKKEVLLRIKEIAPYRYVTFYAGGGTPSLLPAEFYQELLHFIGSKLSFEPEELTLEANPEGLTLAQLKALRGVFNRLSLGVQSLSERGLKVLGRRHSLKEAEEAVSLARLSGFENLSLDLIFGWPGQTREELSKELKRLIDLNPLHVSCYELTLEEGTKLYALYTSGKIDLPPEEEVVSMHQLIHDFLTAKGFEHYEISNYARPGYRCRHNLFYWQARPYLGLGPGAASYLNGVRSKNIENLEIYLESLEKGALPPRDEEKLSPEARFREAVILGLRLLEGIDPKALEHRFGYNVWHYYGKTLEKLIETGLLEFVQGKLRLTPKGRLLANVVFRELV